MTVARTVADVDGGFADDGPAPAFDRSVAAQERLHELVPGGAHTCARGSDQLPEGMAPVIVRGHRYEPVTSAVARPVHREGLERGDATLLFRRRPVAPALRERSAPRQVPRLMQSAQRKEHETS